LSAAAAKQQKKKKSVWARIGDVFIIVAALYCVGFFVYSGASGSAFNISRRSAPSEMPNSGLLPNGAMPFVADQLLYYPFAIAFLAILALFYLKGSDRRFWIIFVSGAAAMGALCLVSLAFEITWVATGVPYTNYSGSYSAWTDPSRYFWPILALSLCLIAALIAGAVGIWALRSTSKSRKTRSVSKARKVGTARSHT